MRARVSRKVNPLRYARCLESSLWVRTRKASRFGSAPYPTMARRNGSRLSRSLLEEPFQKRGIFLLSGCKSSPVKRKLANTGNPGPRGFVSRISFHTRRVEGQGGRQGLSGSLPVGRGDGPEIMGDPVRWKSSPSSIHRPARCPLRPGFFRAACGTLFSPSHADSRRTPLRSAWRT